MAASVGVGAVRWGVLVQRDPWRHLAEVRLQRLPGARGDHSGDRGRRRCGASPGRAVIGPYAVGQGRGSFEGTTDISRTAAVTPGGLVVWALLANPQMVPTVPAVAGTLALVGMFAVRFLTRSSRSRRFTSQENQRRVIVFGAGDACRRLLRSMVHDVGIGFLPVALLYDDRSKQRLRSARHAGGSRGLSRHRPPFGTPPRLLASANRGQLTANSNSRALFHPVDRRPGCHQAYGIRELVGFP